MPLLGGVFIRTLFGLLIQNCGKQPQFCQQDNQYSVTNSLVFQNNSKLKINFYVQDSCQHDCVVLVHLGSDCLELCFWRVAFNTILIPSF